MRTFETTDDLLAALRETFPGATITLRSVEHFQAHQRLTVMIEALEGGLHALDLLIKLPELVGARAISGAYEALGRRIQMELPIAWRVRQEAS